MDLRSSMLSSALLSRDLRLKCSAEKRKRAIPSDPSQPGFDIEEGRGQPAVLLVGRPPGGDLGGPVPDEGVDGFQAVRGLQADPQGPEDAQAVQREGLLEALVETLDGRLVQEAQLLAAAEERRLGLGVARPLVGVLELPAPRRLLPLGEVRDDVLPLVPLAALDHGLRPEGGLDRFPEPLGAVDDAEEAGVGLEPPGHQLPEEGGADGFILGRRLDEAEEDFLPGERDPQGDHHLVRGEGLPIQDEGDDVVPIQGPASGHWCG